MPILSNRAVVAAKIEASEGVAETLAAGDANFLIMEPKFEVEIPQFQRNNLDVSLSKFASISGTRQGTLSFKVELRGSGTAGTAPALGKLLKACGFGETVVASTSVTYAPISSSIPSVTIALYRDGVKKQIKGARGSVKYSGKDGEPGILEFTFRGVYDGVSDVSMLAGTGIEATLPPALLSANFSVQTLAAKISALSWDMNNTLAMRQDINSPSGFLSCLLTARDPKGTIDPEMELVGNHDFYGKWLSNATGALTYKHAGAAGNIITVSAPACQYVKVSEGSRDNMETLGLDFAFVRSGVSGDDELSIAFT